MSFKEDGHKMSNCEDDNNSFMSKRSFLSDHCFCVMKYLHKKKVQRNTFIINDYNKNLICTIKKLAY
jgi:hypothetical protein